MCVEVSNDESMSMVSKSARNLKILPQTRDLCLHAVNCNGIALRYIREQDYELCMAAVKQDGMALQYVLQEQTFELCMAAVDQDGAALSFVDEELFTESQLFELYLSSVTDSLYCMDLGADP